MLLNRLQFAKFTQLAVGHNALAYFKHLSKKPEDDDVPPPICEVCQEDDQTSAHVLGACPAYAMLRWEVFGSPFLDPPFNDLKISHILRFMSETKLKPLQWHHLPQINNTPAIVTTPPGAANGTSTPAAAGTGSPATQQPSASPAGPNVTPDTA